MSIRDALRWTLLLQVIATGLALLVAGSETAGAGWITVSIALAGGALGREWPTLAKRRATFWNVCAVIALVFFLAEIWLLRQMLQPVVHLVVFLTAYKVFNDSRSSDYYTTQMLTFLLVLASSSVSYDYGFALPYALYVLFAGVGLVLATFSAGRERAQLTRSLVTGLPPSRQSPPPPKHLFGGLVGTALVVLLLTVLIFPLLPRFRTDVLGSGRAETGQYVSGFDSIIDLSAISDIKQDGRLVMRVTLGDTARELASRPKLRGIALTHFDGTRWRHSFSGGRTVRRSRDGWFYISDQSGGVPLEQEILLNPINSRSIFHIGRVEETRGPFGSVALDRSGSLQMWHKNLSRIRYEVRSVVPNLTPRDLRGIPVPGLTEETAIYLRLPQNDRFTPEDADRIRSLAEEVTAPYPDLYGKMLALQHHLQQRCSYTLELSPYRGDRNQMLSFLFQRRQGHCVYFASAMTLMARSIGAPARLVNGFQLGQFNPVGSFYTVRAADAHSWVEIWFPGRGWVEFDPTPAGGQESEFADDSTEFFFGLMESIDLAWTQYVLAFDAIDQGEFYAGITGYASGVLDGVNRVIDGFIASLPRELGMGWIATALRVLIWATLATLALAMLWFLVILPIRRWTARERKQPAVADTGFFFRAVRLLRGRGVLFGTCDTARDLLARVADAPYGPQVAEVVTLYERLRFSMDRNAGADLAARGREAVLELAGTLRKLPRR